jgi:Sensors of blue-light using FAD
MKAAMIHQLLYISSATRPMLRLDIETILFTSCRNNMRNDLTGMLIASQTRFMQILDNRHQASVILRETDIEERQFAEWSMTSRFLSNSDFGEITDKIRIGVSKCDVITSSYLLGFARQQLAI